MSNFVVYEDEYLIVAIKAPGIPIQPDKTGDQDFLNILNQKRSHSKELFAINRLDRPVGGLVLCAKDKNTAALLNQSMAQGDIKKVYLAIICGIAPDRCGVLKNYLLKNQRLNISKIVEKNIKGSKESILKYNVIEEKDTEDGKLSLVEIGLITGRHHQIRVQFSGINTPLWGDNKYGCPLNNKKKLWPALWSYKLSFNHPINNEKINVFTDFPNNEPFNLFLK